MEETDLNVLIELLNLDSPAGDEHFMVDWLTEWVKKNTTNWGDPDWQELDLTDLKFKRLRDCLVVTKGIEPKVAIFAHIDTNGFTVGFGPQMPLIPIGSPHCEENALLRRIGDIQNAQGHLVADRSEGEWRAADLEAQPGDRLVYADSPVVENGRIRAPYLDNRGGIWAALTVLVRCQRVAVAFTTGEEIGASGATICARYLYDQLKITSALISDITWDTEFVRCGDGVAVSRRDRSIPSQFYVDQIVALATESGIPYQVEIESEGGSDGTGIERSGCPIDWVFIGAPEMRPHSHNEELDLRDLDAMANMLEYLVDRLTDI